VVPRAGPGETRRIVSPVLSLPLIADDPRRFRPERDERIARTWDRGFLSSPTNAVKFIPYAFEWIGHPDGWNLGKYILRLLRHFPTGICGFTNPANEALPHHLAPLAGDTVYRVLT